MAEKFAKYNRKSITESDWEAADISEVWHALLKKYTALR